MRCSGGPPGGERLAVEAYIGLGSNLGDRLANLRAAVRRLRGTAGLEVTRCSGVYETLPWGAEDQPTFLNAVVEVSTCLGPHTLLHVCLEIECGLGRQRDVRWGPRLIDLDVLLYGEERIESAELTIPHPYLEQRRLRPSPTWTKAGFGSWARTLHSSEAAFWRSASAVPRAPDGRVTRPGLATRRYRPTTHPGASPLAASHGS